MNNISITGNLVRDIELKKTNNDKQFTHIDIAVNDGYGDSRTTFYLRVVAWGKSAENCVKYLQKGDKIGVSGKLMVRTFESKNGDKKLAVEIEANDIEFIQTKGSKEQTQEQGQTRPPKYELEECDEDLPFSF